MQTPDDSGRTADKWSVVEGTKFDKNRAQYVRDENINKRLQEQLELLPQAEDPGRLGDRKSGRLKGAYTIKLSKSIRLLYVVDYDEYQIRLLGVGDHKEIYGRD